MLPQQSEHGPSESTCSVCVSVLSSFARRPSQGFPAAGCAGSCLACLNLIQGREESCVSAAEAKRMELCGRSGKGGLSVYDYERVYVDVLFIKSFFSGSNYQVTIVNIFSEIRIFPSLGVSIPPRKTLW